MIEFNHMAEAIALLEKAVQEAAGKAADDLADTARGLCRVESGFLQSTIYTVTSEHDTYGQGVGSPPGDATLLDEETPEAGEALVGVAADYGAFVELGTRNMPPEPFLAPAAEAIASHLDDYFRGVEDAIARGMP